MAPHYPRTCRPLTATTHLARLKVAAVHFAHLAGFDRPLTPCAFAGGLGPENPDEQLECLVAVTEDRTIWIDMQSKIRSEADELDLEKVSRCLEIASRYVG